MNGFERYGRERKAQKIARRIWTQTPRELRTNAKLPEVYRQATPLERDAWACLAGVRTPSDSTWERVQGILEELVADERRWLSLDEVAS